MSHRSRKAFLLPTRAARRLCNHHIATSYQRTLQPDSPMFRKSKHAQVSGPALQSQVYNIDDKSTQINVLKRFQDEKEHRLIGEISWNKADPYEMSNLKRLRDPPSSSAQFQCQTLKSFLSHKHSDNMLRWEFRSGHKSYGWEKEWASNKWQVRVTFPCKYEFVVNWTNAITVGWNREGWGRRHGCRKVTFGFLSWLFAIRPSRAHPGRVCWHWRRTHLLLKPCGRDCTFRRLQARLNPSEESDSHNLKMWAHHKTLDIPSVHEEDSKGRKILTNDA